jgi:hypothetical protein
MGLGFLLRLLCERGRCSRRLVPPRSTRPSRSISGSAAPQHSRRRGTPNSLLSRGWSACPLRATLVCGEGLCLLPCWISPGGVAGPSVTHRFTNPRPATPHHARRRPALPPSHQPPQQRTRGSSRPLRRVRLRRRPWRRPRAPSPPSTRPTSPSRAWPRPRRPPWWRTPSWSAARRRRPTALRRATCSDRSRWCRDASGRANGSRAVPQRHATWVGGRTS